MSWFEEIPNIKVITIFIPTIYKIIDFVTLSTFFEKINAKLKPANPKIAPYAPTVIVCSLKIVEKKPFANIYSSK